MAMKQAPQRIRRLGLLAAAASLLVSGNLAGVGEPGALEGPPAIERRTAPSRAAPDRLEVQPAVHVPDSKAPFLALTTAEASAPRAGEGEAPTCVSSPLPPGAFRISSNYGMRLNPITGRVGLHAGVDLAAPAGTPIYAVADGEVQYTGAGRAGRSSELVIIDHEVDGVKFSSWYNHMYPEGVFVEAGQKVRAGEKIAEVGSNGFSTGPHLHLEIHTPLSGGGTGTALGALLTHAPGADVDPPEAHEAGPGQLDSTATPPSEDGAAAQAALTSGDPAPENASEDASAEKTAEDPAAGNPASADPDTENPGDGGEQASGDDGEPTAGGEDPEAEGPEADDSAPGEEETSGEEGPGEEDEAGEGKEEFVIEEDDDEGRNDHTIEETLSRTTGIFDPSSLGVLHDPLVFLRALGYGLSAPGDCFTAGR